MQPSQPNSFLLEHVRPDSFPFFPLNSSYGYADYGNVEVIEGTVNDPVKIPEAHKSHGSYHWTFERALSVALVPLIVTPFVTGSSTPVLDALIGTSVVVHSHIGFDAVITD